MGFGTETQQHPDLNSNTHDSSFWLKLLQPRLLMDAPIKSFQGKKVQATKQQQNRITLGRFTGSEREGTKGRKFMMMMQATENDDTERQREWEKGA